MVCERRIWRVRQSDGFRGLPPISIAMAASYPDAAVVRVGTLRPALGRDRSSAYGAYAEKMQGRIHTGSMNALQSSWSRFAHACGGGFTGHGIRRASVTKLPMRRTKTKQRGVVLFIPLGTGNSRVSDASARVIPVGPCFSNHASWMGRGSDPLLVEENSARREKFPVAALVVVHDEAKFLKATLEDVALVIEHVVSQRTQGHPYTHKRARVQHSMRSSWSVLL